MFRDTEKALRRLEEELLEEDLPENEEEYSDDADDLADLMDELQVYPDPDCIYNADRTDENPEDLSRAVLAPRKEKHTGLLIAALLLSAAIFGLLSWWIIHLNS